MARIFGNFISVTYEWKVYVRVGHFENSERRKQTDDRTEEKEKKGGEERREKDLKARVKHYCKEGGLSAATSVV